MPKPPLGKIKNDGWKFFQAGTGRVKSGDQVLDHVTVNVGQTVIPSLKTVGQLLMIEAQKMHPGCLQVMDVNGVSGHPESKFVGIPCTCPPFTPTPAITMV